MTTPAPLINGLPVADRTRRLVAAAIDYIPMLVLMRINFGLVLMYLIGNLICWQAQNGQTIGKRLTSLTVMCPTPLGFEHPGWVRIIAKVLLTYVLAIGMVSFLDQPNSETAKAVSLLTTVLVAALAALWFADRGRRSIVDRLLGVDVLGVRSMQRIPP